MVAIGIFIATIVAFLISLAFYAAVPIAATANAGAGVRTRDDGEASAGANSALAATSSDRPRWWQIVVEILRSALVASLLAGLMVTAGWSGPWAGLVLGLALTVLPVVLLAGSVLWERVPIRSATAHVADWVIKLAAVGAFVGAFV
jgi:hypothetical protein